MRKVSPHEVYKVYKIYKVYRLHVSRGHVRVNRKIFVSVTTLWNTFQSVQYINLKKNIYNKKPLSLIISVTWGAIHVAKYLK